MIQKQDRKRIIKNSICMENVLSPSNMKLLHILINAVLVSLIIFVLLKLIAFVYREVCEFITLCQRIRKDGIGTLQTKDNNNKSIKKTNYVKTSLITASVAALVFIVAAIIANKKFGLAIAAEDIVLTFVGILATFVVVTNYAQVLDIKKEMNDKISFLDRRIKKQMRDNPENIPNK